MNYFPFPGNYCYPYGNGLYEISSKGGRMHVTVTTRGGGQYSHCLNAMVGHTVSIRAGWCTVVYTNTSKPWEHIVQFKGIRANFRGYSILSNWIQAN